MTSLTLYYDSQCGLCTSMRNWILSQRPALPFQLAPKPDDQRELTVVADTGEVWQGDSAWLMVLWALEDYRSWSYRLASPALLPLARQAFATLSRSRTQLSSWLGLKADSDLAYKLQQVELPACNLR
jgi:predicted DCC family thiol-disulfide oxidoreductase YuxK